MTAITPRPESRRYRPCAVYNPQETVEMMIHPSQVLRGDPSAQGHGAGWRLATARLVVVWLAVALLNGGCASMVSRATSDLADNLTAAILGHDDPETVRQGAPAYLLMIDSLIEGDPESTGLLLAGSRLYSSYTSAFVESPERAKRLSATAKHYGLLALCSADASLCDVASLPYPEFEQRVGRVGARQAPVLYGAAAAWATWIQARRDDWVAVADKARVEIMMKQVLWLDPQLSGGSARLYLGVLDMLLPAALGGKPEQGREHLESYIEMSAGRDLMAKVMLAREYSRLVFDRELHDRLCREVLDADPSQAELTLGNMLAQDEARRLISTADEYFGEEQ